MTLVSKVYQGIEARPDDAKIIKSLGDVAIFGGFVRDTYLGGVDGPIGDIDCVAFGDYDEFHRVASKKMQKIGGSNPSLYRSVGVDAWHIQDTWGVQAGHCEATLKGLLRSTFFDWDGVAVYKGKVVAEPWWSMAIGRGVLGLNLGLTWTTAEAQLNRADERSRRWGAAWSNDLVGWFRDNLWQAEKP